MMANVDEAQQKEFVPSSRPTLRVLDVKRVRKNFASVKLPNELVINDVVLGEANGRRGALMPSKPILDRDGNLMHALAGKPRYSPVAEWGSAGLQQEFSRRIVAIVENWFPDLFDGGSPT